MRGQQPPPDGRRFLAPFRGEALSPPPIWLMRQAGRYLPEYRATRAKAGTFLKLCYTPALAAEVTLQPIKRFGFDAAILFSDILVVPDALGQKLDFIEGEGPKLEPIRDVAGLTRLDADKCAVTFERVFETVARVRADLPRDTALIGFCGAPWTVATYMVGGQGSTDQAEARLWAYRDPQGFARLIRLLVDASVDYLCGQAAAGADVLQIFDTWAGSLPKEQFFQWVEVPTAEIVRRVREVHPGVPIIGFPRGAGHKCETYVRATSVQGIGCDTSMPASAMRELGKAADAVVQGNIDPLVLVAGGPLLEAQAEELLMELKDVPFILNLGHGIVPQTPPEHVARLVEFVRGGGVRR